MVDRRDTAGGGDGMGGLLGRLNTALENRIAMLFVAAVLGAGGGVGYIKTNPDARSDPFTGTMGKELARRIEKLEHDQILDNDHRRSAVDGYGRMRILEANCTRNQAKIESLKQRIEWLTRGDKQ